MALTNLQGNGIKIKRGKILRKNENFEKIGIILNFSESLIILLNKIISKLLIEMK